jgi:two-component system, NarL family, invasion response regulator UvrY
MLNIILIGQHDLIRSGIRHILLEVKNLQIINESVSFDEAIANFSVTKADIAISCLGKFDISMLDEIPKFMRRNKTLKIIVITDYMNDVILSYLLKSGIQGCLSMNTNQQEIIQAIKAVKNGERYVSSDIANQLLNPTALVEEASPFKKLTNRELQVVIMIFKGLSSKEIAEKMFLSAKTISTYRNNIFNKIKVKNEVEMVLLAIANGLLEVK